jgi:hypothetical protein
MQNTEFDMKSQNNCCQAMKSGESLWQLSVGGMGSKCSVVWFETLGQGGLRLRPLTRSIANP